MNQCSNCHRRNIPTTIVPWEDLRRRTRKTYYNIRHFDEDEFLLCHLCHQYLLQQTPGPKCSAYWPCMIWKFLIHTAPHVNMLQLDIQDKWKYIPTEWRIWWITDVQMIDQSLSITYPESHFYLGTFDLEELQEAIDSLEWKTLGKAIDKYLAYPSVRCPFGCSEFLHQCNKLSLEEFLIFRSNGCFKGYGSAMKRKKHNLWTNGMKPNFPSSVVLLENDVDFVCRPTIVLDDHHGPCILACSHHRKSSTQRYIYPPESPTGTLYTEMSNQYSQAVIQSRTLRKTKLNSFSDTYQTAMLQGGYDGLDSCFLTSAGRYAPTNNLADVRDCLSISGRDDFRNHVAQLSSNPDARNYVPGQNVQDKLLRADLLYPNMQQQVQQHLESATFITLEDAINLQEEVYDQSAQEIRNYNDDDDEEEYGEDVLFQPPWPITLLWVHPYDGFGEAFYSVQDRCLDTFVGWTILASVMSIPFLWTSVATSINNNKSWKGWLLAIAWDQMSTKSKKTRQKNYFPLHKPISSDDTEDSSNGTGDPRERNRQWLRQKLGLLQNTKDTNINRHRWIWRRVKGVEVMQGQWINGQVGLDQCTVVVLLRSEETRRPMYEPFLENTEWQLRLVVLKYALDNNEWDGSIYARHGGEIGRQWWMQVGKNALHFHKCRILPIHDINMNYQVCVYVRKDAHASNELRNRYLLCLGGQDVIYCGVHKIPLILNPIKKPQHTTNVGTEYESVSQCRCCCDKKVSLAALAQKIWNSVDTVCQDIGSLVCAHVGCSVAMCDRHFASLMINNNNSIYMLTQGACSIGTLDELIEATEENLEDDSDHMSINPLLEEYQNNKRTATEDDDSDMFENLLSTQNISLAFESLGPCDSYEYAGELLPELEDYDSEDQSDEERGANVKNLLSTSAAAEMLDVEFNAPNEIASCPLHILLNQQGHLLVRKKSKLRMIRRHANFFQRIIATTKGKTLPLAYAEALLFPDTFFFSTNQGSILGAIPTALWTDENTLNSIGVASMRKHAKARLLDPATLCSTDSRYHFMMFDCLVNIGMRGNDSRLVLHRGFASKQDGDGVAFNKSDHSELYTDSVENHSNVHKLASLIAESPPHYFFTQSCNQSTCRGLAKLRRWITSHEAISKVESKYGISYEEASHILRKTAAPYVQRVWDVVADLWMRYIVYSKEEPLHKIEWAWWRKEFQDEAGNLSHICMQY